MYAETKKKNSIVNSAPPFCIRIRSCHMWTSAVALQYSPVAPCERVYEQTAMFGGEVHNGQSCFTPIRLSRRISYIHSISLVYCNPRLPFGSLIAVLPLRPVPTRLFRPVSFRVWSLLCLQRPLDKALQSHVPTSDVLLPVLWGPVSVPLRVY